jgi:hypothetical protein
MTMSKKGKHKVNALLQGSPNKGERRAGCILVHEALPLGELEEFPLHDFSSISPVASFLTWRCIAETIIYVFTQSLRIDNSLYHLTLYFFNCTNTM